jgi:hypothetical protein
MMTILLGKRKVLTEVAMTVTVVEAVMMIIMLEA